MKNSSFEFEIGTEIEISNSFAKIAEWLISKCKENVMLLTGPILHKLGVEEVLKTELNKGKIKINYIFKDIPNDSNIALIGEIAKKAKENKCEAIVAIGGGSVLDTAKAVKMAVNNIKGSISGGIDSEKTLNVEIPLICIPTTAGTGSEVTKVVVIYDNINKRKEEIITKELLPEYVLLTTKFIKTLPQKATFTGLMDTLTHAIEAITSLERNEITQSYAKIAIKLILDNIDGIIEKPYDDELRQISLIAANMAGIAFSNSMVGLAHAIAHSLGAVLKIPHDLACALCLVEVMNYNYDKCFIGYAAIMNYISVDREENEQKDARKFIEKISKMLNHYYKLFNINCKLCDYGLVKNNIEVIVDKAYFDGARLTNAKEVNRVDIEAIIRKLM